MTAKQRAAEEAIEFIRDGMIVGLGTGSTTDFFIAALGRAIQAGKLESIRAVQTSVQSEKRAREFGIRIVGFSEVEAIDLTVDGADEIDPQLNLIKGLGGALLREKIVAQNSRRLIIVADDSKVVDVLGSKAPLPVEVARFGCEASERFLKGLGAAPVLRTGSDGKPFLTDNGNYIYDCRFSRIEDPRTLQAAMKSRAGIVETGLFLGMAEMALVADDAGVKTLRR